MSTVPVSTPVAVDGKGGGHGQPFYGWHVALACSAIAFVAWGVGFYNLGVFLHAFHTQRGWDLTALSGSVTVFYVLTGLTGLVAGRIVDLYGPRRVLIIGGIAMGAATLGMGQVRALWQVYALDAPLAIGYGCIHTLVLGAVIGRWFARRRALAMTVALSGAPIGGLALVPLSTFLIGRFGIGTDTIVLALITWGIVVPMAVFVVRDTPADSGLLVDGDAVGAPASPITTPRLWTARQALHTAVWWCIALAFMLALLGQIAFLVHQVNFLSPLIGTGRAAGAASLTSFCGLVGRLLGGIGDRVAKRTFAIGCLATQATGATLAAHTHSPLLLFLTAALFGLTTGHVIALQPLLMVERFGLSAYGTVFGPAYLLTQGGAAGGLLLVGVLADRTGGYTLPFTLTGGLACLAAILLVAMPSTAPGAALTSSAQSSSELRRKV